MPSPRSARFQRTCGFQATSPRPLSAAGEEGALEAVEAEALLRAVAGERPAARRDLAAGDLGEIGLHLGPVGVEIPGDRRCAARAGDGRRRAPERPAQVLPARLALDRHRLPDGGFNEAAGIDPGRRPRQRDRSAVDPPVCAVTGRAVGDGDRPDAFDLPHLATHRPTAREGVDRPLDCHLTTRRQVWQIGLEQMRIDVREDEPAVEAEVVERLREHGGDAGRERRRESLVHLELLQRPGERAAAGEGGCHLRRADRPLGLEVHRVVALRLKGAGDVGVGQRRAHGEALDGEDVRHLAGLEVDAVDHERLFSRRAELEIGDAGVVERDVEAQVQVRQLALLLLRLLGGGRDDADAVGVELVDVEAPRQQVAQTPFELQVIDGQLHPFALVDQAADVERPADRPGELCHLQRAGDQGAEAGEEEARAALGAE